MKPTTSVTPAQLPDLLLHVAVVRPVFVWGQPGLGKSSLVEQFAASLGLDCVSLLGTQLAPEDLIGVPQITADGKSRFCPPTMIARDEPYCLFLDELNGAAPEVQKAFYSLILERRIGEYRLPAGSVIIAAGNRATDSAIVRPMSSALINRFVHVHLEASAADWLAWAGGAGIHPWVYDFIRTRPDLLSQVPPKTEETYSTPRSWHILSDVLHSYLAGSTDPTGIDEGTLRALVQGCLGASSATTFVGYVGQLKHAYDLDALIKGEVSWPRDPAQSDVRYFLAQALRARLVKELPRDRGGLSDHSRNLAHRGKALLVDLADITAEVAQTVVADGDDDGLPAWFLTEVVRDLPRLTAASGR